MKTAPSPEYFIDTLLLQSLTDHMSDVRDLSADLAEIQYNCQHRKTKVIGNPAIGSCTVCLVCGVMLNG